MENLSTVKRKLTIEIKQQTEYVNDLVQCFKHKQPNGASFYLGELITKYKLQVEQEHLKNLINQRKKM